MAGTTNIGVWRRTATGDRYERSLREVPEWIRWAERDGFDRVPNGPRVLLLGESAARGMHLDPVHTPATALERRLTAAAGRAVEVVDLARLGARAEHVLSTAEAAAGLSPDVVVVFAGNNWKYEVLHRTSARVRSERRAVAEAGVRGLLDTREHELAQVATGFVRRCHEIFAGRAPVLFVLPESNLLDWHVRSLLPALPGNRSLVAAELVARLRIAVANTDWPVVAACGAELGELTDGLAGYAHWCVGRAALACGAVSEALRGLRAARDVCLWYPGVDPAWLPSVGRSAAARTAADLGAGVLDLAEILPAHADSGVPDGSLFLDWCHLTVRGIGVVADAIVAAVAPLLGIPSVVAHAADPVPAAARAGAYVCAAVHKAHWDQPRESIVADAETAAMAEPRSLVAMTEFCELRESSAPLWTRPAPATLPPNVQRMMATVLGGRKMSDRLVVDVFRERTAAGATPPSDCVVGPDRLDLLAPVFAPSWRPLDWQGLVGAADSSLAGAAGATRHYFRAHDEESVFSFGLRDRQEVELRVTVRLGTPGAGSAQFSVNGKECAVVPLSELWSPVWVRVPAHVVRIGWNELKVCWRRERLSVPSPAAAPERTAVVFGEIHSLWAATTGQAADITR